jgi:hypothetical protein
MKEYKLTLPDSLNNKELEIKQYLLTQHWKDRIFNSGFCAAALGIEKFKFQTEVLGKFNISFRGDGL